VVVEFEVVVADAVVVGNGGNVTLVPCWPPESPQPYTTSSAAPTAHNIERLALGPITHRPISSGAAA